MWLSSKKENLLREVLREGDYEEFRRQVFEQTRRELRGKKRGGLLPWLTAAAMLFLGIFLGQSLVSRSVTPAGERAAAGPLREEASTRTTENSSTILEVVETRPLPDAAVVRSVARQSVMVSTDARGLPGQMLVRSSGSSAEGVSDEELLALFPNRPVGFVMNSAGERLFVMGEARTAGGEAERIP